MRDADVIRDQYEAVNEGDFERAMSHYAEDVELVIPSEGFLVAGTFHGRDAVGRWFGDWFGAFDRDLHFDIQEISRLADGSTLIIADSVARGRTSGAGAEARVFWVYRLREGKVVHLEYFTSREQAVAGR